LVDATHLKDTDLNINKIQEKYPDKKIITVINKLDLINDFDSTKLKTQNPKLFISAKYKTGIDKLISTLTDLSTTSNLSPNQTIVSNARHYDALNQALNSLNEVSIGLENKISSDLMAIDIRQALYFLGEITGEVTNEDLLGNIFANFCIGK